MGARASYKKAVRIKICGQYTKGGLRWSEPLKTKKQANKKFRKMA